MRILLLTILFAAPLYFFTRESSKPTPEIDAVKLKMSAPDRQVDRILTVEKKMTTETTVEDAPVEEEAQPEVADPVQEDLEHVEEIELSDIEDGWNNELKDMMTRLEPADSEKILKSYSEEQESYQAELDALMNEKHQKTTTEATQEVEQLIAGLDEKHQERLKEIFGAHYEAVRDGYEDYIDSSVVE